MSRHFTTCKYYKNGECEKGMCIAFSCPDNCKFLEKNAISVTDNSLLNQAQAELVNICRKIRIAVNRRTVIVDESEHGNSNNLHLRKFIEMCGFSFKHFILNYLGNIQPYNLIRDSVQEFEKSVYCVLELCYQTALYIKIQTKFSEEVIISFHENQFVKNKKYFNLKSNDKSLLITNPRFPIGETGYENVVLYHGLYKFSGFLLARVVAHDVVEVSTSDIDDIFLKYANKKLVGLWESDSNLNNRVIESFAVFDSVKQLSFTSFGDNILNTISLLVDNTLYSDDESQFYTNIGVLTAQFQLLEKYPNCQEILKALKERYSLVGIPFHDRLKELLFITGGVEI